MSWFFGSGFWANKTVSLIGCPSPDRSGNPFLFLLPKKEKIATDSGK